MNERFLFRGRRYDNGEWITGWITSQFKKFTEGEVLTYIKSNVFGGGEYLVNTKTVGQCTGLQDKNGKLIFEGDIIKTKEYGRDIGHSNVNNFDIFKVIYEPAVFRLENVRRGFNLVGNGNDFEIIGNIHDNPELLEVEK